jgi:hypothetical protein
VHAVLLPLLQVVGDLGETAVFDQEVNQFAAYLVLFESVTSLDRWSRQQRPGLQVDELGADRDELGKRRRRYSAAVVDGLQVLVRDSNQRNGRDVQVVAFDELEEQHQRPLENRKLNLGHGLPRLGAPPRERSRYGLSTHSVIAPLQSLTLLVATARPRWRLRRPNASSVRTTHGSTTVPHR